MNAWQETIFELRWVRGLAGVALLFRARYFRLLGRRFRSLNDYCAVVRLSRWGVLQRIAHRHVIAAIKQASGGGANAVIEDFLADPASSECASIYSVSGLGSHDLFRDFIILKKSTETEKGVILLKYARTFSAVVALFDLNRLLQRYVFVLEPCWAGYCDPSLLMYIAPGNPVLIQCFTDSDYRYVESVGAPLVPIRLGPADWVDSDIFAVPPPSQKIYDFVMVANWAARKRHALLFRALRNIRDRDVRVLLVGFPWFNRTADDVRREAAEHHNDRVKIQIVEKVPQAELALYLSRCKVFVFLSRKEGDNKALVEAMFADVPVVVFDKSVGGATGRINAATGILSSEEALSRNLLHMLDHHEEFAPRQWALDNTGSAVATRILNDALRHAVVGSGGHYETGIVEKTNAPNLAYKDASCRDDFRADYDFVLGCLLDSFRDQRAASRNVA